MISPHIQFLFAIVLEAVLSILLYPIFSRTRRHLKMSSSMDDIVEQLDTMAIQIKSTKDYSRNVGANVDDDRSFMSNHKFTIFFWVCISIGCVGLCVIAFWPKFDKKPAQTSSTTSGFRSRGAHRIVSQTSPNVERSQRTWWKIFSKKDEDSTFKGWPALRRFASRSKLRAEDVEMQRVQAVRNAGGAAGIPALAGPTLHNGSRGTRRLQRPEHLRTDRSRIEGWRAEAERQRQRDAWDQIGVRVLAMYEPDSTPTAPSQPPIYSPGLPEPVAQPNAGLIDAPFHSIFDLFRREESSTPSILEVPPPTYAEHTGDEIAYLSDYQNPAHAAEVTDVQGFPPYAHRGRQCQHQNSGHGIQLSV
jgi:hypothetical protein